MAISGLKIQKCAFFFFFLSSNIGRITKYKDSSHLFAIMIAIPIQMIDFNYISNISTEQMYIWEEKLGLSVYSGPTQQMILSLFLYLSLSIYLLFSSLQITVQ
jgi:hypothetical protein